jgi:2'-5' RNA ligase
MNRRSTSAPNWFFAFAVDGAFLLDLVATPPAFRLVHPADAHLTLAFLGACGEASALRALDVLDECLLRSPCPVIDISFGEVVAMGSHRRYSALSALVRRGREAATTCVTALRDVLTEAATGQHDPRPAKPHVTIARPLASATHADRAAGLTWAAHIDLRAVDMSLDRIALYTWSEDRRERMFRIVAERNLG